VRRALGGGLGRALAVALTVASSATPAHGQSAQGLFDREKDRTEPVVPDPMPKVPEPSQTREFYFSAASTNRFAIDPASVAIDNKVLVRFTLVITSRSGVRNVSYEAIRCSTGERQVLAIGRPDGTWTRLQGRWVPVTSSDAVNQPHTTIAKQLCDGGAAASLDPAQLVKLLTQEPPRTY
jgi:hypothetical protein